MIEKIYSRKRIKIPKIKHKKYSRINILIGTLLCILALAILSFIIAAYPIFTTSCKTAANSKATNIVNDEVVKVMDNYSYNDLVKIEKDENGNINLIQSNTVLINQIISKIILNIQNQIDHSPTINVYINYGSVSRN